MYIKKINQKIQVAPYFREIDGKKIYGYNKETNEAMLIAEGYLKYEGVLPIEFLDIIDGVVVEKQLPRVEENKTYSKLKIRRTARAIGKEDILNDILNTNENFYNDWNDAQEIDLDDEMFAQLSALPEAQKFVEELKILL